MKIAYLLDIYGNLLDEHTSQVMLAYYNDDLSLAEIASDEGLSRQGVRHLIKKGEERLYFFDERLGLCERYSQLDKACELLSAVRDSLGDDESHTDDATAIAQAIEIIKP